MNNQVQFVCLWCCVLPDFAAQINIFLSLVLFPAAIHKIRERKLISKTIKRKRDNLTRYNLPLFYPKDIHIFVGKLSILLKIWK